MTVIINLENLLYRNIRLYNDTYRKHRYRYTSTRVVYGCYLVALIMKDQRIQRQHASTPATPTFISSLYLL